MRDYVKEFPFLNHLIGGYFHQDWTSDGETPDEVINFYCRMERPESRCGAVSDIKKLLAITETESQLADALRQFGCAYRIDGNEESIKSWLERVYATVHVSLEQDVMRTRQ